MGTRRHRAADRALRPPVWRREHLERFREGIAGGLSSEEASVATGLSPAVGSRLAGHGAEAVRDAIAASITTLPEQLRRSLTWDRGAEMAQHAQLRIDTGVAIYFLNPQSPWQRGTNGLLRQYFPKAP